MFPLPQGFFFQGQALKKKNLGAKFERKQKDLALGVRQNTVPRVACGVSRYKVGHVCLRLCLRSESESERERERGREGGKERERERFIRNYPEREVWGGARARRREPH
jgi:hypothetical protein